MDHPDWWNNNVFMDTLSALPSCGRIEVRKTEREKDCTLFQLSKTSTVNIRLKGMLGILR